MDIAKLTNTGDEVVDELLSQLRKSPTYTYPSVQWCLEIASCVPCGCLQELLDNADKVREYCKEEHN